MRKLLLIALIGLLLCPLGLQAGTFATLKGKVTDTDDKPLMGVTVRVLGTTRGAFTKQNGFYLISNIAPGKYSVVASMVGKGKDTSEVELSADVTTTLNIAIGAKKDGGVTLNTVKVVATKMVENDRIGNVISMRKEDLRGYGTESVSAMIGLSVGADNAGGGVQIRGSRAEDTQIQVDGLEVGNQFVGGYGGGYFPMVSSYATEEVQVITGGFSAEYGEAMGGVVNTILKTGKTDRYEGNLAYRTDASLLYASREMDLKLIPRPDKIEYERTGEGAQLQGNNQHIVEFGVGGPLPFLNKSTFYISGSNRYDEFRNGGYELYDIAGNNLGQMPDNQVWVKNIVGRMRFGLTNDISLIVGTNYGISSYENSSWSWLYANDEGILHDDYFRPVYTDEDRQEYATNGIPERIAKQWVSNKTVINYMARINHAINEYSYYEITVSTTTNDDMFGRRVGWEDPNFFTGFDIYEPEDKYEIVGANVRDGDDKLLDMYQVFTKELYSSDNYFFSNFNIVNPLTGYYEGAADASGSDNPYGRSRAFITHGNSSGLHFRLGNYWQADGDYELNINSGNTNDFSHTIRSGFLFKYFTMHRHLSTSPWSSDKGTYDIYTDEWGGNIYAAGTDFYENTSSPVHPMKFELYAQDQMKYKGIILSAGLRFDMFMPESKYRIVNPTFYPIDELDDPDKFSTATTKMQVSPRLNITYPLTESSNIAINYGMNFKMPQLNSMYDKFFQENISQLDVAGSPNMEAQRTNQYQIQYNNQMTNWLALIITAYYKDIYNQLGRTFVGSGNTSYYVASVADYGNSKGLEFQLTKKPNNDHIDTRLTYEYSFNNGTSSAFGSDFSQGIDPYTGKYMIPLTEYPLGRDVRHKIRWMFQVVWQNNQGPSIGGIQVLENVNVGFTTSFSSGSPYTKIDASGKPKSEINAARGPSYLRTDMSLRKRLYLKDLFGDFMDSKYNPSLDIFLNVNNLFNRQAVVSFYPRTGDPIDDGVTLYANKNNFQSRILYSRPDFTKEESFARDQYDIYGDRRYSENLDYDNNGIITVDETFRAWITQTETTMKAQGNYQYPRTAVFGIVFNF